MVTVRLQQIYRWLRNSFRNNICMAAIKLMFMKPVLKSTQVRGMVGMTRTWRYWFVSFHSTFNFVFIFPFLWFRH